MSPHHMTYPDLWFSQLYNFPLEDVSSWTEAFKDRVRQAESMKWNDMLREDSDEEELDYSDEENEEARHARMLSVMSELGQVWSDFQKTYKP